MPNEDVSDTNFVFLRFAMDYFPKGLIGLFIAILFLSGIFLGNLFAQETHLNTEKNNATIHAKSSKSSSSGHGKTIFFMEKILDEK